MTALQIQALPARDQRYCVTMKRGLELIIGKRTKRWRMRYRFAGRQETYSIGLFPAISPQAALTERSAVLEALASGVNPAEGRREERGLEDATVQQFGGRWVAEVVMKARKDPNVVIRYLERDIYPVIGARKVSTVAWFEVQKIIFRRRDEGRPEAAAALRHLLKRLFDYAKVCGLLNANPVDRVPLRYVTQHKSRSRTLSAAELRQFMQRIKSPKLGRLGPALEIILLTMCRKSELRMARWEHVNLDGGLWELPAELSKTGAQHIFYLSVQAVSLFRRLKEMAGRAEIVLPAMDSLTHPVSSSALNKVIARHEWGIAHFTPHDLRRTAATILSEQGYEPDWIEKALNHQMPGLRGVYNRAQYGEQRRKMLQDWADWLEAL